MWQLRQTASPDALVLQLLRLERAVRAVAVIALHQSFVHPMMESPGELRSDIHVAAVAELWRRFLEQKFALLGVVRRMAIDTRNSALQVGGTAVIALLVAGLMAIKAASTNIGGRCVLKREDLCFVAAALNVLFARTVARLAAMPLRTLLGIESGYEMRRCFVTCIEALRRHVFMAGFASLCPYV